MTPLFRIMVTHSSMRGLHFMLNLHMKFSRVSRENRLGLKINSMIFLLFLSASFPSYGGAFQKQIYDTAEKGCMKGGFSSTDREGWTVCIEAHILLYHERILAEMGYSKPSAKTAHEVAEERCSVPKHFILYNVNNKEDSLKVMTPIFEEDHRKIWSQTSELD